MECIGMLNNTSKFSKWYYQGSKQYQNSISNKQINIYSLFVVMLSCKRGHVVYAFLYNGNAYSDNDKYTE